MTGFNVLNKHNSFYNKNLDKDGPLYCLIESENQIYVTPSQRAVSISFKPLKAKNSNKWLVISVSTSQFPIIF